jgi:hypothetical protein
MNVLRCANINFLNAEKAMEIPDSFPDKVIHLHVAHGRDSSFCLDSRKVSFDRQVHG